MEEHNSRLFVCHVLMDGNNVDLFLEQRFQNRLQFIFRHCEISIDNCIVVAAGESRPRVDAHGVAERDAVHFRRTTEREFYHSIFRFALRPKDLVQRLRRNRIFFRQRSCAEGIFWLRIGCASLFKLS